jgi:hypothetical protein
MINVIKSIAGDPWQLRWKSHLPEICAKLDETGISHPPKWPSWTGQLTTASNLVLLNIAHSIEVYADGAAALPEPKPIQRETGQRPAAEIQIGMSALVATVT